MKKCLRFLLLSIFFTQFASAQSLPCGGGRFSERVFATSTITSNIFFGANTTYAGFSKNLYMDIYQPAGDVATIRPLFIFAFGGAFVSGDRTQLAFLCDSLARKGYVAAAIDYRLYDNPSGIFGLIINPNDGIDAVAKGMSDIKAAIRYFKRDAATVKTYKIDTTNIFLGGISSGSIAALHTAYINTLAEAVPPVSTIITNNGGMEGNTDIPGTPLIGSYTFKGIKGVWNMSGALYDSGYIKAGDATLFGVHGTADGVVPFSYGQLFSASTTFGAFVCGSSCLNNQAIKVGVANKFIPVLGGDHEMMYYDPTIQKLIDTTGSKFFGGIVCPAILPVTGISLAGLSAGNRISLNWQTLTETMNKSFVIEKQAVNGWTSIGEVRSKTTNGYSALPLSYNFEDLQPANGANFYRLKMVSLNNDISYSNVLRIQWTGKSTPTFVIYPNPVGAILTFKKNMAAAGTASTIRIYTPDMRLVQTNKLLAAQSVPVGGLSKGLYLAIIFDEQDRQAYSSWFIRQ